MLSMGRRWKTWPTLEQVSQLRAEDGAILRQMSLIEVRDGRWRGLGPHPKFDKSDWPWHLRWYVEPSDRKGTLVRLQFSWSDYRYARVDRKILDLDPDAGRTTLSMSGGDTIALDTYRVIEGIDIRRGPRDLMDHSRVTPQRIAAWKKINPEILAAMQRAVSEQDQAQETQQS